MRRADTEHLCMHDASVANMIACPFGSLSSVNRNSCGTGDHLLIRVLSIPGVKHTLERDMIACWHGLLFPSLHPPEGKQIDRGRAAG